MKKGFLTVLLALSLLLLGGQAGFSVLAAEEEEEILTGWQKVKKNYCYYSKSGKLYTGWKKISGKRYYFLKKAEGTAVKGSRVTGFRQIDGKTFYFNSKGVLQTGWKKIGGKTYYFTPSGAAGTIGAMAVGFQSVGKYLYLFQEDGSAALGWATYDGHKYYFSKVKTLGLRGRARKGWVTISSEQYYFNSKGQLQTGRWISGKYYVDEEGRRLKSTVTPDGYVVGADGKKQGLAEGWVTSGGRKYYYESGKIAVGWKTIDGKTYYFNKSGLRVTGWIMSQGSKYYMKNYVMQTGWQTINQKKYYFQSDGKMAVNTTIDGYEIGANGVAVDPSDPKVEAKVLLVSGHGMGDVGAQGIYGKTIYNEYQLTRQFSTLVQKKLELLSKGAIEVTMYNQNYDLYQVMSGKKNGPVPKLKDYDYILEIHFNATAEYAKDTKGDGSFKGVGMYVNYAKKNRNLDQKIVKAVANTGFRVWGGGTGIFTSTGLFNARTCQAKGVSYGLLETAFIDDKDDITFYNKHKEKMAEAVAKAIIDYYC